MDFFRRNYKAIAGALVGVLAVLLPAWITYGTITPETWGFAVAALIGGHQIVYATAANKTTVETALGVVLPALSKSHPYVAQSVKAAINAVPEYVPTAIPKPSPTPRKPDAGPITPAPGADPFTDPLSPKPAYTGPIPPVSEPVGATTVTPAP